MDETRSSNFAELRGTLGSAPVFSHLSRGERFFTFPLETERLSGTIDRVNIIARQALLDGAETGDASRLHITGEVRSFNNRRGEGSKLVITLFSKELDLDDGEDTNLVELEGTLCKPPNLRTTPMGRDICDIMLDVNRRCGRSDYLPCICWGLRARDASLWEVGDRVALSGRLQSRQYIKLLDGVPEERTAFEISVADIARLE